MSLYVQETGENRFPSIVILHSMITGGWMWQAQGFMARACAYPLADHPAISELSDTRQREVLRQTGFDCCWPDGACPDYPIDEADVAALPDSLGYLAPSGRPGWVGEAPDLFNRMLRAWFCESQLPLELIPVGL